MGLACSRSELFNFCLFFTPANCLEIVQQIRDFRGDCLYFWLFMRKKGVMHNTIWATNTMLSSRKKPESQSSQDNFQIEEREDLIHR